MQSTAQTEREGDEERSFGNGRRGRRRRRDSDVSDSFLEKEEERKSIRPVREVERGGSGGL